MATYSKAKDTEAFLRVFKLHPEARLPKRSMTNAWGFDVYSCIFGEKGANNIIIGPGMTRAVPTGIAVQPPDGHGIMVCSRSGLAREASIFVINSPGIVDPDFTGEVQVLLYNGGRNSFFVHHGARIAQLLIQPAPIFEVTERPLQELPPTERGDKGWGSTGK